MGCVRGFSSLDLSDPVVISGELSSLGCTDTLSGCLYPTVNVLFRLKKVVVFTVCSGFLVVGVSMSMVVSGSSVVVATVVVVEGGGRVADKINEIVLELISYIAREFKEEIVVYIKH